MMTLISNTAQELVHGLDVGPHFLVNFGILEEVHINDRFNKFFLKIAQIFF